MKTNLPLIAKWPVLIFSWWKTWKTLPVYSWILGAHYFRQLEFLIAAKYYKKGLKQHSSHKAYYCALLDHAYCLYRIGQWKDALEDLSRITVAGKALKHAYLLQAEIELLVGNPISASRTMLRCLEIWPGDERATVRFAEAVTLTGVPTEFLDEVKGRLDRMKRSVDVNDVLRVTIDTAIARYELFVGNYGAGKRLLSRVIATGQAPREALVLRAECLLEEGHITLAQSCLNSALEQMPHDPKITSLLARTYLVGGQTFSPAWALQLAVKSCQQSFWQNPEYLQVLAEAYEASGDESAALLISEKVKALSSLRRLNIRAIQRLEVQIQRLRALEAEAQENNSL